MATGRPDNIDPEGWFEAAVRIDQVRATNAAFRASIQPTPVFPETISTEKLPPPPEVVERPLPTQPQSPDVLNIKDMSADDIRKLRQRLFDTPEEFQVVPTNAKKAPTPKTPASPFTPPTNRFQGLPIEEVLEDTSAPPVIAEATCERPLKRP